MFNNKKKSQHSLKVIKRFDEDIWGVLATKEKPTRVINYLFEVYQNNYKYRRLLRRKQFFLSNKKLKFLYKTISEEKEFKRKKRTMKINNYLNGLKLRRFYGSLGKREFKKTLRKASLTVNILGRSFVYFLESRLDVVLYRANFFSSIMAARQQINHKKVFVNGKVVNKPGYRLFINDIVTLENPIPIYIKLQQRLLKNKLLINHPNYLEVNYKIGSAILTKIPTNEEVPYPFFINLNNITHNFLK